MGSEEYPRVADYFVVAGLTENSQLLDEDLAFPNTNHKLSDQRKDPITDIVVIDKTLEENCPQGFTCIEQTPGGLSADLNHGSLTAHSMFLCYKRGKNKPPLINVGVCYEGLETVRQGISVLETTPAGRCANVNNKSGMGSHPIYVTFGRAKESAPQNSLVVTDICVILTNKGERAPYAFCQVEKNLNKGLIGSSVYICYKKSMRQVDSIPYKAGFLGRYPLDDVGSFPLPATVPLFCLPMGATVECWSNETRHPLPTFSSFVLTTETSEKVYGAVVSFYENYPEEKLSDEERYKLGLLRGDGLRSRTTKTVHTNKAICLLSRWPMFSAFHDFLMYLYKMTISPIAHTVPVERHIGHFLHNVPFPSSQRPRVQYQMSPFHLTILTRPQITPIPLSGASFLALLDDLGPENTMSLLVLALTEHKIVIHSLRPAEITRVAEAVITLLFPFKWQCTYVPLCPLEMGYVLEAPCPFIVGVDSRYFDLYEPPPDVACVNLDTNSITIMDEKKHIAWKLLPRKPAKLLRSTLQTYYKEVKECPREESIGSSFAADLDITRTERHRYLELAIQEAVLKLMAVLMKGYRQYLLPITEAPSAGTTDPSSLFNIQDFVKSREKSSHRIFNALIGTQLFSSFIEERSLTSFIGGEGAAGRSSSLVFFDECIDRLTPDFESVKLIEADNLLKSEHTVMIMAPDETGLPPGVGYQYTTFPELQDELFMVDDPRAEQDQNQEKKGRIRRKSDTFTFGRRTKQEVRTMQKVSKMDSGDPQLWARLLLSHTYGAWFACLPAFVLECRHKAAALRTAHNALHALMEKDCFPLPDETYYRMLLHLCSVYNKPALAVRVFHFIRNSGTQLSAITYGLYNKAVLEGTWPASNRDGYMLWQKLRNVLLATRKFRYGLRRRSTVSSSERSSELDTTSHTSVDTGDLSLPAEDTHPQKPQLASASVKVEMKEDIPKKAKNPSLRKLEDDCSSTGGQSDHGYNSLPKDQAQHSSPLAAGKPAKSSLHSTAAFKSASAASHTRSYSGSAGTTDSVISSNDEAKPTNLERNLSNRSVQPPSTLDIPSIDGKTMNGNRFPNLGLKSDDTLVNKDGNEQFLGIVGEIENQDGVSIHPPRASPRPSSPKKPSGSLLATKSSDACVEESTSSPLESPASVDELVRPTDAVKLHTSYCPHPFGGVNVNGQVDCLVATGGVTASTDDKVHKLKSARNRKVKLKRVKVDIPRSNGTRAVLLNGSLGSDLTKNLTQSDGSVPTPEVTCCCDPPTSTDQSAHTISSSGLEPDVPPQPVSTALIENDGLSANTDLPASNETVNTSKNDDSSKLLNGDDNELQQRTPKCSNAPYTSSAATPEIANLFGSDAKFLSSLSDSDQRRYHELCSRRPSSLEKEQIDKYRSTRHGSLVFSSNNVRGRSGSMFTGVGGISPLIGQKSIQPSSNPNTPNARNNFDSMTAEDLMLGGGSPSHSLLSGRSGSILANRTGSPNRSRASSDSPVLLRNTKRLAGSNNLVMKDGVPMLASTPLRTVIEPPDDGTSEDGTEKNINNSDPSEESLSTSTKMKSKGRSTRLKQEVVREDISHLAQDPLSPGSHDPPSSSAFHVDASGDAKPMHTKIKSNSLSRHLVEEIEDYLENDSLIRCSSDGMVVQGKKGIQDHSEKDMTKCKLHRIGSLPSDSPKEARKVKPPHLKRSMTYHEDQTSSPNSSWFGSNSKMNSLKTTTMGMASKAKKAASNFAKDLNETMQAGIAYYTPEKTKGSSSDLRDSQEDVSSKPPGLPNSRKQGSGQEQYSSQSSLRSSESLRSAQDAKSAPRQAGRKSKKSQKRGRPLSVPHFDSNSTSNRRSLTNSYLSIPGVNNESSEPNITASMTSLNIKGIYDIEVIISSCSRCHRCGSLVYDEEIMAGWIGDDSSLNTHCPFCHSLFVPFLDIEITDYRNIDRRSSNVQFKPTLPSETAEVSETTVSSPPVEEFSGSFTLRSTPETTQRNLSEEVNETPDVAPHLSTSLDSSSVTNSSSKLEEDDTQKSSSTIKSTLDASPHASSTEFATFEQESTSTMIGSESQTNLKLTTPGASRDNTLDSPSTSTIESRSTENIPSPRVLEPVTVPYLSSLVLRKELESLLENEGIVVLTEPEFVDHHPIIYWNLVWYFRRLNLYSNLYNLLLQSQLVQTGSNEALAAANLSQTIKGNVMIHTMWDNLKLHDDAEKPPMYCVWHQLTNQASNSEYAYSSSFLVDIRDSIKRNDVRGPLVAVLNELNVQKGIRRSAYREILYLIIVALGKTAIDINAFDREYRFAYDALAPAELALATKCDRRPSDHATDCRDKFGELDVYI